MAHHLMTYFNVEQRLSEGYGAVFPLNRAQEYLKEKLFEALEKDLVNYKILDKKVVFGLLYPKNGLGQNYHTTFKTLKPHIHKILDLDDDVADLLIKQRNGNMVLDLRDRFAFEDQEKIEYRLIKNRNVDKFATMFEKFQYYSKEEIKELLLIYGANPQMLPE
ncbi:MAG: hypothetical protein PHU61_03090 [Candidatus Absconditabacteria bacterium]|nr:hypothetical protein [Candidatus Absconditabacteria bacterium]MDD3868233.1 hypothetical protein [Candidatus Absconditabacteria bacterium]MDD4714639.1 hypothetical protein [Candidatus Absconditabacteria bacterium]